MARPHLDLATYIAANVAGLTLHAPPTSGNVFAARERAPSAYIPEDAVFCFPGAGQTPDRVMSLRFETRYPMVTVRVRARTEAQAETWARAVQDLLQTGIPSGYMDIEALQSEPTGADESPSTLVKYSMTFKLTYDRDALA